MDKVTSTPNVQSSPTIGSVSKPRILLVIILVASLVLLSGCPRNPDPGPSPTTEDEKTTSEKQFPPGANETGLSEPIVDGHDTRLTSLTSFTYVVTRDRLVDGELREVTYRLEADVDDGEYLAVTTVGDLTENTYYTNGTFYRKRTTGGETTYAVRSNASAPTEQVWNFNARIEHLVEQSNFTLQGTETTDGGETRYVYTADEVSPQFVTTLPASNASVEVAVTRNGLVRTVRFEYDVRVDGETHDATFVVRLRGINDTTVSRPEWVEDAARNASSRTSSSTLDAVRSARIRVEAAQPARIRGI